MLILFLLLILSPNKSFAWLCVESLEPKDLLNRHDLVFVGKVTEVSYENVGALNPKNRTAFEIKSIIKGDSKEQVTIVASAGSEFLEGKEYLVYAYQTTKDNYLYKYEEGELAVDTMCGGTKELSLASYDLEQFAKHKESNAATNFIIISIVIIMLMVIFIRRRNRNP